jgi:hypothetical protein
VQGGFFLVKKPLGRSGFGVQQLENCYKQAAEKGMDLIRTPEKHPSRTEARVDYSALTARLKSCPDTKRLLETYSTSYFAACKALVDLV